MVASIIKQAGKYSILPRFCVSQGSAYAIRNKFQIKNTGRYRIANNAVEGYCVYVGIDGVPDFTGNPEFNAMLPITINTTPPVSGTAVYNVVVRKRNKYGLESQNQKAFQFEIDSAGNLVAYPVSAPTGIRAILVDIGKIRVAGEYSDFLVDLYPADRYRIWINTTAPDVEVDAFSYEGILEASTFGVTLTDTYLPDTYYIALVLYRYGDNVSSTPITTTIEIPDIPASPVLTD